MKIVNKIPPSEVVLVVVVTVVLVVAVAWETSTSIAVHPFVVAAFPVLPVYVVVVFDSVDEDIVG